MTRQQQAEVISREIDKKTDDLVIAGHIDVLSISATRAAMLAVAQTTIRTFGRYAAPLPPSPQKQEDK